MTNNIYNWKQAGKVTLPVAMGYTPAGIAFGILASSANIPWWLVIITSIIALAGAAQYAFIDLVKATAGIINISLNTLVINLRHVFYALPLLDALPKNRWLKAYCLFCLTDEGFSVLTTLTKEEQKQLFVKISFLVHSYWVIATIIGVLMGKGIANIIPNLDFALASLFVILWYEQVRAKRIIWPSFLSLGLFLIFLSIFPSSVLILSLICCVILILTRGFLQNRGFSS